MGNGLRFMIDGKDAEAAAVEIKEIFRETFGEEIHIIPKSESRPNGAKSAEVLALAAIILAIPGAVLAVADIIGRLKKKKKLDQALTTVRERVITKREVTVKVIYPDGMVKHIQAVDTMNVIEMLSENGNHNE